MNAENLDHFVVVRKIDKKHFVEAALADHFGGQQVNAIRRSGYKKSAGFLLHPGEEEGEDAALLAAGFGGGDAHLDFVKPEHGGRHVLHHLAGGDEDAFGLAVASGKDLDHVDAIQRKLEVRSDGLDAQALAATGD